MIHIILSLLMAGLLLADGTISFSKRAAVVDYQTGRAKDKADNLREAINFYTQAINLDPSLAGAYFDRAFDERKVGDLKASIADYTKAIELRPIADVYSQRGYSRILDNDKIGALEDADESLRLTPSAFAYLLRNHIRRLQGDLGGAIDDVSAAIKLEPDPGYYHIRALDEEDIGKNADALADLRKGTADINSEYSYLRIWIVRARMGEKNAASAELQAYLNARKSKEPNDWFAKIVAFLTGKLDEQSFLDAAIDPDSKKQLGHHCEAYFYIGCMHLLLNDKAGAADDFNKSLQTGLTDYDEYRSAVVELQKLNLSN